MTPKGLSFASLGCILSSALLAAALPVRAADSHFNTKPEPRFNTIGDKPFGLLLLGEGGDRDWRAQVEDSERAAQKRGYPFQFAPGMSDRREIQRGIDELQRQRVKTIVVVPLAVSSYGEELDQVRFLLGIREKPSKELIEGKHTHMRESDKQRIVSRVPLVLTKALDDDPLLVEMLRARALSLSRHPAEEALVLVGQAPESNDEAREWLSQATALAEKVRQKGGFAAARAFSFKTGAAPDDKLSGPAGLTATVKELRREHPRVIVLPLVLSSSEVKAMRLEPALEGLFASFAAKSLLPDPKVTQWVEQTAIPASKLPDMRLFKESPKASLTAPSLTHEKMEAPPSLKQKGDKFK